MNQNGALRRTVIRGDRQAVCLFGIIPFCCRPQSTVTPVWRPTVLRAQHISQQRSQWQHKQMGAQLGESKVAVASKHRCLAEYSRESRLGAKGSTVFFLWIGFIVPLINVASAPDHNCEVINRWGMLSCLLPSLGARACLAMRSRQWLKE